MGFVRSFSTVIVALLATFLYYRSASLYQFYSNAPERLERVNSLANYQIRFKNILRNCEDLYLNDAEGFALISCDPGRDEWNTVMGLFLNPLQPPETGIYLYRYAESPETEPIKLDLKPSQDGHQELHPLGIEFHPPTKTMFVANHVSSGSRVDVYNVDLDKATATFSTSIKDPKIAAPNSIAMVSDSELFITNDHHFRIREHPILARIETYAAIPGGSIVYARLSSTGQAELHTLAHLPFANGIVLLNSSTIAVASCAKALVQLYTVDRGDSPTAIPTLSPSRSIPAPFIPDNLSLDTNGKLLIAGHPHAPSIEKVARGNRFCNKPETETSTECQLPKLSQIAEWDEQNGLKVLYAGSEFGTATTAARDMTRGLGFAAGLYERGLLTWEA